MFDEALILHIHIWNVTTIYDGFFPSFESKSKCEYEDLRWAVQFTIDSIYTDRWTINTHAGELPPRLRVQEIAILMYF